MARGAVQGSVGGLSGSSESEATVSPGRGYSPSTHRARSSNLHRSVQNGRHAGSTGWLRQYAHTAPATGGISTFYGGRLGRASAACWRQTLLSCTTSLTADPNLSASVRLQIHRS